MPEIIFNGPEGRLEGRYHHSKQENPSIALMLHPHPQYGGSMNNRVIYQMYHCFVRRGFSVLRFNFRGVGRSQGPQTPSTTIMGEDDNGAVPATQHGPWERDRRRPRLARPCALPG